MRHAPQRTREEDFQQAVHLAKLGITLQLSASEDV